MTVAPAAACEGFGLLPVRHERRLALVLVLGLVLLFPLAREAGAQALQALQHANRSAAAAETEAAAEQSLETLLAPTVRRIVAEELGAKAPAAEAAAEPSRSDDMSGDPFAMLIQRMKTGVGELVAGVQRVNDVIPQLGEQAERAYLLLTLVEGWGVFRDGLLNLAAMFIVGIGVAIPLRRLFRRILVIPEPRPDQPAGRVAINLVVALRDIVVLAIFFGVAFLFSLVWFEWHHPIRDFQVACLGAACIAIFGWIVAGFIFAAGHPARRLVDVGDRTARHLTAWMTLVFGTVGVVGFSVGMIRLLALEPALFDLIELAAGVFVATITLVLILVTARGDGSTAHEESLGSELGHLFGRYRRVWLLLLDVLFLVLWIPAVLSSDPSKSAGVAIAFATFGLILCIGHPRALPAPDAAAARRNVLGMPRLGKVLQLVLGTLVFLSLLHVLAVDMVAAIESPTGRRFLKVALDVAIILVVATAAWALVQRTVARYIRREEERARAEAHEHALDEDGLGGQVASRFGTLLPLIRGFILTFLAAITLMVVLSSMGIDIGPLLAGAGVVGIAIGFGAQALVRDIISGIFFLIDDAFRVGEYVEFGTIRGQVEQISIRSMRLRHHRGAINTVPFGELRSITNYNRDWAIYKQEFRLPYDADLEHVRKIIKKVGIRLMEDPELGPKFLQPLKSQGVFRIEEGALIVRTKFMCKPREQFIIRKAVFQEVTKDLYAAGYELAQRRVQIEWPEYHQGKDDGEKAAAKGGDGTDSPANRPELTPALAAAAAAGLVISSEKMRAAPEDRDVDDQ